MHFLLAAPQLQVSSVPAESAAPLNQNSIAAHAATEQGQKSQSNCSRHAVP
jgi:hypothetical protein